MIRSLVVNLINATDFHTLLMFVHGDEADVGCCTQSDRSTLNEETFTVSCPGILTVTQ